MRPLWLIEALALQAFEHAYTDLIGGRAEEIGMVATTPETTGGS